jgi:hypothetical protein
MKKIDLKGWPDLWPSPDVFLGPLVAEVASLQHISAMMEHQVIIRFKNHYGVKISQNSLHEGLYSIAVLRFSGSHLENYRLVKNSPIPEMIWCFKSSEVLSMCEEIARWKRRSV